MVELELNKLYSTQELCDALEIKYDNFKKQKNQYLKSLSLAYTYEVSYIGRGTYYTITEKIGEYEKPARKNARAKADKVIKKFINDVIDQDPLQTAANINRRAWENSETKPTDVVLLGLKNSTTGEYIRLNLREMYGTQTGVGGTDGMIEKKVWCSLNSEFNYYEEMAPEMVDKFFACFDEVRKDQKRTDLDIVADYDNGLITREEMKDKLEAASLNIFYAGKELFHSRYGFYPIKVPVYIKRAWLDENQGYKV